MKYPLTTFHFQVEWAGARLGFTEVCGLDSRVEVIEYREGNSASYASQTMPGRPQLGNVTFKRGMLAGDNDFFDWLNTIKLNQVERRDLSVQLLNEQHEPVFVWRLRNAWPVAVSGPKLDASASEVAIEAMEIAHEGIDLVSA